MGANSQSSVPAFTAGQVLTAQQQTWINTGIPVFDDTTQRDGAFGGSGEKTLAEGQFAFIETNDLFQYYDGSTWKSASGALTLVKTQTVGTGVASVTVTDAFSSTYDNYLVTWTGGTMASDAAITFQLGPTSVPNYNTAYYGVTGVGSIAGVFSSLASNNATTVANAGMGSTDAAILVIDVLQPNLTRFTGFRTNWIDTRTNFNWGQGSAIHRVASAFTGFVVSGGANLTGGTIRVYGYQNS